MAAGGKGNVQGGGGDYGGARDRGTLGQQQDRRNMDAARRVGNPAPGVRAEFSRGGDVRNVSPEATRFNPRREFRPSPSYEMSPHNMMELAKIAGRFMGGPVSTAAGMIGGGWGAPDFQGFTGMVQGPGSYDPSNRMGQGLLTRMMQRAGQPTQGQGLQFKGF